MALKRTDKIKKTIGDYDFYISKFGAFKSANLSGELLRLFTPILASAVPTLASLLKEDTDNILDRELDSFAPAFAGAFNNLSGKEIELLMRKLLIEEQNISFVPKGCMDVNQCQILTMDDADEIFCGDVQDMYLLAIAVIQENYKGFFSKLASQYGLDVDKVGEALMKSRNMAPLMSASSAN